MLAGLALLGVAALLVRRPDGERRAFAVVVLACIVASPIVWQSYAALLFVPIAILWRSLAPAWFFGYAIWLGGVLAPKPEDQDVCCRPADVTPEAWAASHAGPNPTFAAVVVGVALAVGLLCAAAARNRTGRSSHPSPRQTT